MAGAAVSWSSKKQPSTALSSTEAEYLALTHSAKEAIWIQSLLDDLGIPFLGAMTLLGDNQGALALAINPTFHARTKHICVRHHFIRECVATGNIRLQYTPTNDQMADILTKGLQLVKHEKFTKELGLGDLH